MEHLESFKKHTHTDQKPRESENAGRDGIDFKGGGIHDSKVTSTPVDFGPLPPM